jgi:hypothetical protein
MSVEGVSKLSRGSAVQEALETRAETKAEAASGDQQAKRKLAAENAAPAAGQPNSAAKPDGSGTAQKPGVDPDNKGSRLDTHA